jgi:hypothetical protein
MACNISSGISLDCRDSQGGVLYAYIANGPVDGFTETAGLISAITVGGSAPTFFKFEFPKQTASFTETVNASTENGTVFYTQELTMVFNKMEAAKRNQLQLLAQNQELLVIVKDGNGKFWTVGLERGAVLSAGTNTSGAAYGDRNGMELTLQGLEAAPSYEVSASVVGE